ncbi:hypothetical protein ACQVTS_32665 [Bacillus mycoides]|uniref:hypothetical protein n=1 Tax=Bacillus mycoides TaxID=1405 RepID=UPI003D64DC94
MEKEKEEQLRTTEGKKQMLVALSNSLSVVTPAAKQVGITPETHRLWMKKDLVYREKVLAIKLEQKDFVESKLMEKVNNDDTAAIIYANKSLNRDRGYGDKVEHSGLLHVNQFEGLSDEELSKRIAEYKAVIASKEESTEE